MFKQLIAIVAILCFGGVRLFAQENVQNGNQQDATAIEDTVKQVGIHPWKKVSPVNPERAYWTLYIHGGFNVFDGDFTSEKKHGVYAPSVGLGCSYYFNNTWSIGVDYIFRQYKVTGSDVLNTAPTMLKGNSHQIDAYITFDIFNAWRPQNRFKLFALNLILGGGVGWFKNSTYYPNEYHREPDGVTITLPQRWDYHTAQQTSMSNRKYQARSIFLGGASFDFNITRSLALGVRCVYNYYTKDDIDGRERGNNNDGVFDATVMLRYKIDAEKKSHVANFRGQEALDMAVRETNPRHYVAPYDGTGAYAPDTVVATHDTVIIVRGDGESANYFTDLYYYVYFDVGEHFLYDESLKTIQQVADRLARDENLCLEIVGYCDNTGSSEFNEALGRNRALSVAEEFKAEYGISESRIYTEGRGIIRGRRSTASYSPNRRADIRVITRDMFELLHGVRPADNQAIPQPKMVEVGRGETLSKLARKYYGNVHCWVYIFEANLNKLATPNSVKPGMEIAIPVLTDQQMLIDKDEAEKRYEKYKIH